jgi:UDP-GlcNAc:undecaprenyl-phosphate GlcNAc-1-phosphate transferase
MQADRGHLHHRLIDMGLTQKQSVAIMYSISAVLGLCAVVMADKGPLSAIILVIVLSAFVIGGARYMNEINNSEIEEKDEDKNSEQCKSNVEEPEKAKIKETCSDDKKSEVHANDIKEIK